jgi:hypothetical protein
MAVVLNTTSLSVAMKKGPESQCSGTNSSNKQIPSLRDGPATAHPWIHADPRITRLSRKTAGSS